MHPTSLHLQLPEGERTLPWPETGASDLAAILHAQGLPLNTRCGGRGLCAGCTVHLAAGTVTSDGATIAAPAEIRTCRTTAAQSDSLRLVVPARSLLNQRPQIATTFKTRVSAGSQPIVPVRPGECDHGLAIDIGTTTVVVALVDLVTGQIVATAADLNRQAAVGDNVVTRIIACAEPTGLERLHKLVTHDTLDPLIRRVCTSAKLDPARVAGAAVAGNTTMLHLLARADPLPLGRVPFTPAFLAHQATTAGALGLTALAADTPWHLLPGMSAYVGADLTAGVYATGMRYDDTPSLLVDVGTNGEIVLAHRGKLIGTATAAGPAFEGGQLSNGMRAMPGAISEIALGAPGTALPATHLACIPGGPAQPLGLCGSAYVDFLSEARRAELLGPQGRFNIATWEALPPEHRGLNDLGLKLVRLAAAQPSTSISEGDIAHLLQAKAAIGAGILTLLQESGLKPGDVGTVFLAGGFGLHLDVPHAIRCGLLPEFRAEQIEVVGNTALGGAWLALIDASALAEMNVLAAHAEILELNTVAGFEDCYLDQLSLP